MFLKSGWVVATLFLGSKLEHGPKLEMKQQQKHGEPEMEEIFNSWKPIMPSFPVRIIVSREKNISSGSMFTFWIQYAWRNEMN